MQNTSIIERALEIMEEKGWNQGSFGNDERGYCISGALYQAATEVAPFEAGGRELFASALRPVQNQIGIGNVANWNDRPERTFAQVREVMRRAAYEHSGVAVAV